MYNFLQWSSLILTPIGFVITVFTLINTRKIKATIEPIVNKAEIVSHLKSLNSRIDEFIKCMDASPEYKDFKALRIYICEISNSFNFESDDLKTTLEDIVNKCHISKDSIITEEYSSSVQFDLTKVNALIQKEVRPNGK